MELHTERLHLRQISSADLADIYELHAMPETDKFNTLGIPETIHETEKVISGWLTGVNARPQTSYIFRLDLAGTTQFIGLIALNLGNPNHKTAETWYKTLKHHWNKGYTTEALFRLLNFGFHELKLHRIEAGCAVENTASIKVLEKVGMKREGRKNKKLPIRGEWKDSFFYAILDEEFFAS